MYLRWQLQTVVAAKESCSRSQLCQMSATQAELAFQLRDILGPAVTHRELDRLLAQSYGSVQRAVDIYFTNGPDGPVDLPLQEVPGPSSSVAQTVTAPAREGPPRGLRALPPTASPVDFVTLSSSTDNDYDPGEP